jgi:hypothetical protein
LLEAGVWLDVLVSVAPSSPPPPPRGADAGAAHPYPFHETEPEAGDSDRLLLARAYFDGQEYRRAAFMVDPSFGSALAAAGVTCDAATPNLHGLPSAKALFFGCYSLYLVCATPRGRGGGPLPSVACVRPLRRGHAVRIVVVAGPDGCRNPTDGSRGVRAGGVWALRLRAGGAGLGLMPDLCVLRVCVYGRRPGKNAKRRRSRH